MTPRATAGAVCVNVGILWTPENGGEWLAHALCEEAGANSPAPEEGEWHRVSYAEYDAYNGHYAQLLIPSGDDCAVAFAALRSMDGVVVSVRSDRAVPARTKEWCYWAKAAGVPRVIFYVWHESQHEADASTAREAVRDLANSIGLEQNNVVIVTGTVEQGRPSGVRFPEPAVLLREMARHLSPRRQDRGAALLMPVDDVFSIKGRGTIVTGRVERGLVRQGDTVELVGFGTATLTNAAGIEIFNGTLDEACAGDFVGIQLSGVGREAASRGMVVAAPGSVRVSDRLRATVYFLRSTEGGLPVVIRQEAALTVYAHALAAHAKLVLAHEDRAPQAGQRMSVALQFERPVPVPAGTGLILRQDGATVGVGIAN